MQNYFAVISSKRQCQKVPLSITDMFVMDHKEKVSFINRKIVGDKTRTNFLCDVSQTFLLLLCMNAGMFCD